MARSQTLRPIAVSLIALFCLGASVLSAAAQSALDGFDPNASNGVGVASIEPDGSLLIGGGFTTIAPNGGGMVLRNSLARIRPDGSVDPVFNPNVNGWVRAIVRESAGTLLIAGYFLAVDGQSRRSLARIDSVTGQLLPFNANLLGPPTPQVYAIALQADGKILIAGDFTSVGGRSLFFLARLDPVTGLPDSFDPKPNLPVRSLLIRPNGKILVGGDFNGPNAIGGQIRNGLARLDSSTGLPDSFDPNVGGGVYEILPQADGKMLIGGTFTSVSDLARNRIARIDGRTGRPDSFNPNANAPVYAIAVQADGKILAGGSFRGGNSIGGALRDCFARLDPVTGAADSFGPIADNPVLAIVSQADGKILLGGQFKMLTPSGGTAINRNSLARLETDGRVEQTLNLNLVGAGVSATAIQPDGKILIGGSFSQILGVPRQNLARLHPDGSLDLSFNPGANSSVRALAVEPDGMILVGGSFNLIGGQARLRFARLDPVSGMADASDFRLLGAAVEAIALQGDGKILLGGSFFSVGGETRSNLARLHPVSGLPDAFNPGATGGIETLALQSDGKILVGGFFHGFNSIAGQSRDYLARLDPETGEVDGFDPSPDNMVSVIVQQSDGPILVGGAFTKIGGESRIRLARLDEITGRSDAFNPSPDETPLALALQADGKILVGGTFYHIGGAARCGFARLEAGNGAADSFDAAGTGPPGVSSLALQRDGKILVGGFFSNLGGQPRQGFARLRNDTPAANEFDATRSVVRWRLSGATPQMSQVIFDYSTDNVNYGPLGSAIFAEGEWTLSGLELPAGRDFYLRARGTFTTGLSNASASRMETVCHISSRRSGLRPPFRKKRTVSSATSTFPCHPKASPTWNVARAAARTRF